MAGREGGKPVAAFYPARKTAVGQWVTISGINIEKMNIGRIKENTAVAPARFRSCLKTPALAGGSHMAAPFYAAGRLTVGCWETTRAMSIKKMKIGRIKENMAVYVRFRPCLKATGLTIESGKKSDMAIGWKAVTGVVRGNYIGRIRLVIRGSIGRIT